MKQNSITPGDVMGHFLMPQTHEIYPAAALTDPHPEPKVFLRAQVIGVLVVHVPLHRIMMSQSTNAKVLHFRFQKALQIKKMHGH
jgi:hypothetical protein